MRALITSILGVEELARDVYRAGAEYFADDPDFAEFLASLADDEALHADAISRALQIVEQMSDRPIEAFKPAADKTPAMRNRASDAFKRMRARTLCKQDMIACVLDIEMSEWNDLFLYVVDVLKDRDREFELLASHMQSHKEDIVQSCRAYWSDDRPPHPLDEVPPVWTKRTLVVDDEPAISNMLIRVLRNRTNIEVAKDGKEAVEKVRRHYYDAVISDVNMPVLDGMQFLQQVRQFDPDIARRFLFFSAGLSEEQVKFLAANHIRFLDKPASIASIRNELQEIWNRKH